MSEQFVQELDPHDEHTLDDKWGPILATKAAERFVELYLNEWAPYAAVPKNIDLMFGWCEGHAVPATLRNLTVAFYELIESDQLCKSPTFDDDLAVREAEEFRAQCPEYDEHYANQKNSDILQSWLAERRLAITAANLLQAFEACVKTRQIVPAQTGFVKREFKSKLNMADQKRAAEEREHATKLAPNAGEPVTKDLKLAYQASLQKERANNGASPREIRDARIAVGNAHPELEVFSKEFASLVSAEILRNRQ